MLPTQRAADKWDSARFTGIFLASSFSCPHRQKYSINGVNNNNNFPVLLAESLIQFLVTTSRCFAINPH